MFSEKIKNILGFKTERRKKYVKIFLFSPDRKKYAKRKARSVSAQKCFYYKRVD